MIADIDAAAGNAVERRGIRHTFNLHPVLASMRMLGVEQTRVEARFIAEQQQSFRVGIESADRINVSRQSEVRERPPARSRLG